MSQRLATAGKTRQAGALGGAALLTQLALVAIGVAAVSAVGAAELQRGDRTAPAFIEAYAFSALESEVAGIHPHPTRDDLFLVAANSRPSYQRGQHEVLPAKYRGNLLVVNRRSGVVERALPLGGVNYGGLAYGDGLLYVSSLDPAEILKLDLESGRVVGRIPIAGPAGGLEYDGVRGVLLAQLYVSHPSLAVVNTKTGVTEATLWSDENAMDLARVSGDLLCTWISSFDGQAVGELRRIDPATGKVLGRMPLPEVHTSMAALDKRVAGTEGFISLVRVAGATGKVGIHKYGYDRSAAVWQ
jgi:outer membrane protein assembly factor BamB